MAMNDLAAVKGRLRRGMGMLSATDVTILLNDIYQQLEELRNEQTSGASGSNPVPGVEGSASGAKRGRKPRKLDEEGADPTG